MHKHILTALAFAAFLAPVALAQAAPPPVSLKGLTAKELQSSLFGVHLYGTTSAFDMKWDECIEPGGDTLYTTPGGAEKGRLTISPKGLACFAYEGTGFQAPQCFVVRRNKDGFSLVSEFGGEVFVTTKVVRGIRTCDKQDLIG